MSIDYERLMSQIESLPVDMKLIIVEKLLADLQPIDKQIDDIWSFEVQHRMKDIEMGKVKTIPGNEVFHEIREKYNK